MWGPGESFDLFYLVKKSFKIIRFRENIRENRVSTKSLTAWKQCRCSYRLRRHDVVLVIDYADLVSHGHCGHSVSVIVGNSFTFEK